MQRKIVCWRKCNMANKQITYTVDLSTKKWLNLNEAIAYLGFGSKGTFQKWRDESMIPFSKIGANIVYRRADLDKMVESHMVTS